MDLIELRQQIDEIDNEIVKLYQKRLEVVKKVGQFKKQSGTCLSHANRENDIVERLTLGLDDVTANCVKNLYATIFDNSKKLQSDIIEK